MASNSNFCASGVGDEAQTAGVMEEDSTATNSQNSESISPAHTATPAYSSYIEYIGAIREHWPQYDNLYKVLKAENATRGAFRILIADSGSGGVKTKMYMSDPAGIRFWDQHLVSVNKALNADVIKQLRSSPEPETDVRIIVVELAHREQTSSRDIIDAIGMLYDVDPAFFDAFYRHQRSGIAFRPPPRTDRSPLPSHKRYLRLHGHMAAQVLENSGQQRDSLKVVLVLSWMSIWKPLVHGIVLDRPPTIRKQSQRPISQLSTYTVNPHTYDTCWFSEIYSVWLAQLDEDTRNLKKSHPIEFIYPWIEYNICNLMSEAHQLRGKFFDVQRKLNAYDYNAVDEDCFAHASDLKNLLTDVAELLSVLNRLRDANQTQVPKALQDVINMIEDNVEDANQLLRLITEAQQLFIGSMAIQESRRSITEAISVKRLTQLAFVFIPLSYVSSIFGMNIQEMTGDGPKLWIFLATSFSLLIGALLFWGITPKVEAAWASRMDLRSPAKVHVTEQLKILYASFRTGNFVWMIRSGVFLGLLTRNRFGDEKETYEKVCVKFYANWCRHQRQKHLRPESE